MPPRYAPSYRERRQEIFYLKGQGKMEEALERIRELLDEGADTPELAVDHADALARLRRPAEALEILERARESHPTLPPFGRALRAGLLQHAGRLEEARAEFELLAGEPALSAGVARRVADFFRQHGDPARASRMLERIAEDTVESYRMRARNAPPEEALALLAEAVKRFPDSEELFEDYVLARLRDEPPEVMAEELETLLSIGSHENSLRLRERLAQCLRKLKEPQRALELLQECVRRQPDNGYFLANLGYVYRDLGQTEAALEYLEQAMRHRPDDTYALSAFLKTCKDAGLGDRARAYVAVRARTNPRLWGAYKRIFRSQT